MTGLAIGLSIIRFIVAISVQKISMSYKNHIINLLLQFLGLGNMKYSVLSFYIVPPCSQANTASLELNISPYCPPSHDNILLTELWVLP